MIKRQSTGTPTGKPQDHSFALEQKFVKKVKNPWAESTEFLQDLRSRRTQLHHQLVSEILTLKQEQASAEDLAKFKSDLAQKVSSIEKAARQPATVCGITGFASMQDVCESLFELLGLLELVHHAYCESDAHALQSSVQRGRLIGYLQLLSRLKRPATASTSRAPESAELQVCEMKINDLTKRLESSLAENKKLQIKLDVRQGGKQDQIQELTISGLKDELERMDERLNDLKAKNTRMVQVQVDHAKEMILLREQLGKP